MSSSTKSINNSTTVGFGEMVFQTLLSIVAVLYGYPNMGMAFILLMAPFVVYMVIKKDASFLPALMIHCSSLTSIMYAVFFSMIIVCFFNTKQITNNKQLKSIFLLLILIMPIYIVLTIQKSRYDSFTWQGCLAYTSYYFAFWSFLYCYLIHRSFSIRVLKTLLLSILVLFLATRFSPIVQWTYLSNSIAYFLLLYGMFFVLQKKHRIVGILMLVFSIPSFLFSDDGTFTFLLTVLYAMVMVLLWNKKKQNASKIAGIYPYIIVLFLMVYGISNYKSISIGTYSDTMDFSSWSGFINRAKFKLFDDRAPFWAAGWEQLLVFKPVLPIHDIPDITAEKINGQEIEVSFGAHNTPLQLLRIFGFIMGGVLIYCYVKMSMLTAAFLNNYEIQKWHIPLFSFALASTTVFFLTGTGAMLPDRALLLLGIMGIAYGKSLYQK